METSRWIRKVFLVIVDDALVGCNTAGAEILLIILGLGGGWD